MHLRLGLLCGVLLLLGTHLGGQDTPAVRAEFERRAFVVVPPTTREVLPARVVNTTYLPVVTTQGPLGTCGAYGVTYYYRTFLKARQQGWVRPDPELNPERCASTAYTYKLLRHDPLAGANILGTVMDMVDFGVCSLADLPYTYDMDTYTWPEEQYWKMAMPWRPRAAGQIPAIHTLAGQAVLKSHLYGGGAGDMAVIALRNAPNVVEYPVGMHTDNEVIYALQEAKSGIQHAFTVIGYDDNREYLDARDGLTKKGAFLAVNSWGQGWGVVLPEVGTGGFVWFAYDLFLTDLRNDWNGGTAAAVMLERGDYAPQTMVRIGLTGDTRMLSGGLSPSGEGGGEWVSLFPGMGEEAHPTDQGIWIDVTDMLASGSAGIRFHGFNFEGGPAFIDDLRLASGDETAQLTWTEAAPVQLSSDYMAMTRLYVGRYQNRIPTPERSILTGDAAWCDWNGDGLPDAAVASPEGTWLWTNTGNGRGGLTTTEDAELPAGHTLRWLDANGDGHIDLLIASDSATTIYAGNGAGTFSGTIATLPACRRQAVAVADFNRDGRPDLALGEATETAVYLNNGTGFDKISQSLPALSAIGFGYGTLAAADVDGDGRPDLLLAGAGVATWNTALTRLYRNAGLPLHFEEMQTDLPAVKSPAVAFGDANGDGRPDLAISGCADPKWMRLYLNDGSGSFQERNTALPPLREGTLQWCDLNADGRPDLVATGATADDFSAPGARTIAVINRPDGTFADFGLPLPNAYRGFLVAQDVTGDANPDLLVGGSTTWYNEQDPAKRVCALYDYSISTPGLFPVNTPPTAPDSLACEHAGGGVFTFTWESGADAETPTAGLRYEWRCGRTEGAGDIVHGELARSGVQLRQPPVGTLYWQVRTVDSAGVASAWATAQYTVPSFQLAYHLRLQPSPAWGGSVESSAASPIADGTAVTLTATAAPGFEFVRWEGDTGGLARSDSATFTIGEDRWIQAVFAAKATPVLPVWTLARETIMDPSLAWYYHTRDHTLESFGGKLVRLGGRKSDGYPTDMILRSLDNGATWQSGLYLSSPRYGHASVVFDGKLWVAGGVGSGGTLLTDVCYTTDLVTWTTATAAGPWSWREGASLVVANGKLWYLGGDKWGERYCDVWYSTDGANWTAVPTPAGWVESPYFQAGEEFPWPVMGTGARVTVLDDVIYGTDGQSVWSSPDGVEWTMLATEPDPFLPLPEGAVAAPFGPLHKFGFTTYDGEVVLLGGENWRLGETTNDVWSSPDGQAWTRTAPASRAHWDPRKNPATAVHNGKLFLVGGESAAGAVFGDVWHCVPGEMPVGMGALVIEATPQTPWVGGTTEPSPGFYVDNLGKVFNIRAVPAYGYVLDYWEGPVVDDGDGDPCTVRVTLAGEETRVKAVFTYSVRLTVRTDPYGAGITVPEAQTAYAYPPNEWVSVSAKAKDGYVFTHWTGPVEDSASANTRVFMDGPHEVVAMFRKMPLPNSMACATDWAAVIRDGVVWGVGNNGSSQMGHELPVSAPGEFWPVALFEGAEQVYVENAGVKAVCTDGTVTTWGSGYTHYLLGVRPHASYLSVTNVAQITGGSNLAGFFRKKDGTLVDYLNKAIESGFGAGPLGNLIDVTSNGSAHFVVDSGGLLYAWGSNLGGQLGIPDVVSSDAPREVPGIDRVYATALGRDSFRPFTLALRNDCTVWSWGDSRGGQLGRLPSGEEPAGVPTPVPGLADIVQIAAGSSHGLALTYGGQLYAWGTNQFGQLGTGGYDDAATPVLVPTPALVVDVAAGAFYSLMHLADDTYCWMGATPGDPSLPLTVPTAIPGLGAGTVTGQLELVVDPADADGSLYPPPGTHPVVLNRAIHFHADDGARHVFSHWSNLNPSADMLLPLTVSSTVTARFRFAYDAKARLRVEVSGKGAVDPAVGDHEYAPGTVLTLTALPAAGHAFSHWEGAVAETDASRTTVLMDRDQTVQACFTVIPQTVPPRVATGLETYSDALLLKTDTTVQNCRASGDTSGVRMDGGSTDWLAGCLRLAVGRGGLCLALALDSTVWSWGGEAIVGGQNRLDGLTTFPGKVVDSLGVLANAVDVSAGDRFGLALLADGTLRTWGDNGSGQLGHSSADAIVPLARTVRAADGKPLTQIQAASCGSTFALAVRQDGTVLAWGSNTYGELGRTAGASSGVPEVVAGLRAVTDVEAGRDFGAALDASGQVWTWGRNDEGQCGRSSRAAVEAPGIVPGLPPIAELALGETHALARDREGGVWAWGNGENGRLGNGDTADSAVPVQVLSPDGGAVLAGIVTVDCGVYSYAIGADGRLYSWGFLNVFQYATRPVASISVGASDPSSNSLHALSLGCFPPEGGTLSPGTGTMFLSHGTLVTVSAVAAPGYRFQYWQGTVATTTERVLGLRLVQDTRITAHFAPLEPRLRLGTAETLAGGSAFLGLYLEGDTAPVEGISATVSLPAPLRFVSLARGSRLADSCLARGALTDDATAVVLVSGTDDTATLTPDGDLPVFLLQVGVPADCPPGDYPVRLLPTPAVAIAAGRAWVEPAAATGLVRVLPAEGIDLLLCMQAVPGPESEQETTPTSGIASVRQGRSYVAELWLRDQRLAGSAIAEVHLDVQHGAVAACDGLAVPGLIASPAGAIAPGAVTGFGGVLSADWAPGRWYRLGGLQFSATDVGTNPLIVDPATVVVTLADTSVLPTAAIELWLGEATVQQEANAAPTASAKPTVAGAWGTQILGQLAGADPNAGDTLVFTIIDQPSHGTLDLDPTTGTFVYTPFPYHTGADSFTFAVSDGVVTSSPVTQTLFVTTGWCVVLSRGEGWAMLGREASGSDQTDDPGDLLAVVDAPLAFVPARGQRATKLARDMRSPTGNVAWRLEIPAQGTASSLAWDPSTVPAGLRIMRIEPVDCPLGTERSVEMHWEDTIPLAGGVSYIFDVAMPTDLALDLGSGWNLVCLPGTPVFADSTLGQPDSPRNRFVWRWSQQAYLPVDQVEPYTGYWFYAPHDGLQFITILPAFARDLTLEVGWNIIGVPRSMRVGELLDPDTPVWRFRQLQYELTDQLDPGEGYWLFRQESGVLNLAEERQ